MITFEQFIAALQENGTKHPVKLNSTVLGGIDGMPVTHQVGFGSALIKGIHPQYVNISEMNKEVITRIKTALKARAEKKTSTNSNRWNALLSGAVAAYSLYEIYEEWVAGHKAAQYLDKAYFSQFPPIRKLGSISGH